MLRTAFNQIKRLWRAREGVAAVEFAMVAPIMMLIFFGIVELSLVMYSSAVLEGAVSSSARLGKTGYTQSGVSRQDMIYQTIKDRGYGLLNPAKIQITTLSYSGFNQIGVPEPYTDQNNNQMYNVGEPYSDINGNGQWDNDMGTAGLGGASDVVVYRVTYPWPVVTPIVGQLITTNGIFNLQSSVVVKNEPYNTTMGGS